MLTIIILYKSSLCVYMCRDVECGRACRAQFLLSNEPLLFWESERTEEFFTSGIGSGCCFACVGEWSGAFVFVVVELCSSFGNPKERRPFFTSGIGSG